MRTSFINNNYIDEKLIEDNRNIIRLTNYVASKQKINFKCLICNYIWSALAYTVIIRKSGCRKCSGCQKKTTEEFILKSKEKHGDKFSYPDEYKGKDLKLKVICKIHGEFNITPKRHLKEDSGGCMKCVGFEFISNEVIDKRLLEYNKKLTRISDFVFHDKLMTWKCERCLHVFERSAAFILGRKKCNNCPKCSPTRKVTNEIIDEQIKLQNLKIIRIDDSLGALKKINWKCLNCFKIFNATPSSILNAASGCSHCIKSRGEKAVEEILLYNNIDYITQYQIKINGFKRNKRIDFYLPKYNLFIEYNGIQHYEKAHFHNNFDFQKQIERDQKIREYCIFNKINLLEIDSRKYFKFLSKSQKVIDKEKLQNFILDHLK